MICIRRLPAFKKIGCPEHRGPGGCPAWIERQWPTEENPLVTEVKRQCLDLWMFDIGIAQIYVQEGARESTDQFRKVMTEEVEKNGKKIVRPRPDPAILEIIQVIESHYRPLEAEKAQKEIRHNG